MSPPRWHPVAFLLAAVIGLVLAGAAGTARGMSASQSVAAGTTTYSDPANDAGGGPDLLGLTIAGDPTSGALAVTASMSGFLPAAPDAFERDVYVWIDADNNPATGDPEDGTEYGLEAWNDATGKYWAFERWNGSDWVDAATPTMGASGSASGAVTWRLNTADIGGATSFGFYAMSGTWDNSTRAWTTRDYAPNTGRWNYAISGTTPTPTPTPTPAPAPKVSLQIAAPQVTPRQAVAGKRFTVSFRVTFFVEKPVTTISVGTGETGSGTIVTFVPVTSGKMICDPSVSGKVIAHSESLKNGQARLSFVIPKSAKGKLLKVKLKIVATEKETGKTLTSNKVALFRVH